MPEFQPSVVGVLTAGGAGSGAILDPDGMIVTTNHVVAGSQVVRVALATGERLEAEVVANDPLSDLAVLRVDRGDLLADEAGIGPGDVVIELDGEPVREVGDLLGLLHSDPGDRITLTVLRCGDRREVEIELEQRPRPAAVPPIP